jgi:hypothetical protein
MIERTIDWKNEHTRTLENPVFLVVSTYIHIHSLMRHPLGYFFKHRSMMYAFFLSFYFLLRLVFSPVISSPQDRRRVARRVGAGSSGSFSGRDAGYQHASAARGSQETPFRIIKVRSEALHT